MIIASVDGTGMGRLTLLQMADYHD